MADNVSSLVIKIESKQARKALDELKRLAATGKELDTVFERLHRSSMEADKGFRAVASGAAQANQQLRATKTSSGAITASMAQTSAASQQASAALLGTAGAAKKTGQAGMLLDQFGRTIPAGFANTATTSRQAAGSLGVMTGSAGSATKATKDLGRAAHGTTRSLEGIINRSIAAGAAFLAFNKLQQVAAYAFQVTDEFERLEKQLTFVTGGTRQAAEAFAFLEEESMRTGQSLRSLAPQYSKFVFSLEQAGISAEEARTGLQAINNASATFALTQSEVNSVMNAFIQVASKGKLQAEEIRKQIGERLPGAFALAARSIGMTTQELSEALETGNIMAQDFLPKFFTELNRAFGDDIANKTDTLGANMRRLRTEVDLLIKDLEANGVFDAFITGLRMQVEGARWGMEKLFGSSTDKFVDSLQSTYDIVNNITKIDLVRQKSILNAATFDQLVEAIDNVNGRLEKLSKDRSRSGLNIPLPEERNLTRLQKLLEYQLSLTRQTGVAEKETIRVRTNLVHITSGLERQLEAAATAGEIFADSLAFGTDPRLSKNFKFLEDFSSLFGSFDKGARGLEDIKVSFQMDGIRDLEDAQEVISRGFDFPESTRANPFEGMFQSVREELKTTRERIDESFAVSKRIIERYYTEAFGTVTDEGQEMISRLEAQYDRDVQNWAEAQRQKRVNSSAFAEGAVKAIEGIDQALVNAAANGKFAWQDMAQYILASLAQIAIKATLLKPLYAGLGNILPGAVGDAFSQAGGIPANAMGGSIPAGQFGIAGEKGPEIIRGPAVVTSTDKSSGYGRQQPVSTNVVHLNIHPGTSGEAVREARMMVEQLRHQIPQIAQGAVQSKYNRHGGYLGSRG